MLFWTIPVPAWACFPRSRAWFKTYGSWQARQLEKTWFFFSSRPRPVWELSELSKLSKQTATTTTRKSETEEVCENTISTLIEFQRPFMAGQLQNYIANWQRITSDSFNAHCQIDFEDEPLLRSNIARPQYTFSKSEKLIIDNEIEKFPKIGIIEPSMYETCQVISPIFTRVKKDGSRRVIFNLKKLNKSVSYYHFKMDTLEAT